MAATTPTVMNRDTEEKSFVRRHAILLSVLATMFVVAFIGYLWDPQVTTAVLNATLRQSTPLLLGALCGLFCERSGVVNIGIEGQMLMAAFVAFMVNAYAPTWGLDLTVSLWLGLLVGISVGALMGLFHAWMSVTLKIDQIIGGTVINILALGLTGYFYQIGVASQSKFLSMPIPVLSDIPLIGPIFFNNGPLTYMSLLLVFLAQFVIFYTRWGLRTRAVGEHPRAADTVGIKVNFMRYANVVIGGCLAGLAGAYLTLEAVGAFERNMTNGRGFVALAVMLLGKRTPFGVWGAALLFGFANAIQTQLQFGGRIDIPHQFIGMLPYVLTILVLAGFVGRTRDPKALGQPYEK
ncbi:MAG: ABC transporter permease [Anaerolineales bacterium]|nr:ABC transporter permease [Anaerolineales bacterium]